MDILVAEIGLKKMKGLLTTCSCIIGFAIVVSSQRMPRSTLRQIAYKASSIRKFSIYLELKALWIAQGKMHFENSFIYLFNFKVLPQTHTGWHRPPVVSSLVIRVELCLTKLLRACTVKFWVSPRTEMPPPLWAPAPKPSMLFGNIFSSIYLEFPLLQPGPLACHPVQDKSDSIFHATSW